MKKNTKNQKKTKKVKKKIKLKFLIFPILISFIIAIVCFVTYSIYVNMFKFNPRFILKHVEFSNKYGNWSKRQSEILEEFNIIKNVTNIFDVKLRKIKEQLERKVSIEKVEIKRILPDTIELFITESEPQAFLGRDNSKWVINSKCVVISYADCIKKKMPYVVGFSKNIKDISEGETMSELKPAINLLEKLKSEYSEIVVKQVDIARIDDCFVMVIEAAENKYCVLIPHENLDFKLQLLYSTLFKIKGIKNRRKIINLQYNTVAWQEKI